MRVLRLFTMCYNIYPNWYSFNRIKNIKAKAHTKRCDRLKYKELKSRIKSQISSVNSGFINNSNQDSCKHFYSRNNGNCLLNLFQVAPGHLLSKTELMFLSNPWLLFSVWLNLPQFSQSISNIQSIQFLWGGCLWLRLSLS